MKEATFQIEVCRELRVTFPGCHILKNDPDLQQGFPDLLILFKEKWAALEVKGSYNASHQPNQDYWVDQLEQMSFGAFIFPENREEIFNELRRHFKQRRATARINH